MADVAILGATGPTGIHLANILRGQKVAVRVASRSAANLQRAFGAPAFEKVAADVLDADAAIRAVDGCPLVYDCLGLPAGQMHLHPAAAQNIAKAVRATGARCIQVSSYWAYLPLRTSPLNEAHPRSGGPDWVHWRRGAGRCELESAREIALGIIEDFVAQFRAAHDIARNCALQEPEVVGYSRSHLLNALLNHFAHVGRDLELWCRAAGHDDFQHFRKNCGLAARTGSPEMRAVASAVT